MALALPWSKKKRAKASAGPQPEVDVEARYKPIDLKMILRLTTWLRPYKKLYITGILLGTVMVGLRLMFPKFIEMLVDYTNGYVDKTVSETTAGGAIVHILLFVFLPWMCTAAIVLTLERFRILMMTFAGESVQMDLRRAIFKHLQKLSMSYYDKTKLGRIISRCTSDIGSMREVNVWGIDAIVINGLTVLATALALGFVTSWRLFFAVIWLGPVLYITNRLFLRKLGSGWQTVREGFTRVSTNLAENITGMRVVMAFNRQNPNLNEFNRLQDINTENNVQQARINGLYMPTLLMTGFLGKFIILIYGGYLVVTTDSVTVGRVVGAWIYWDFFVWPLFELGQWYNKYMQAMAGGERVFQLLDTEPDVVDLPQAKPLGRIVGTVEFENVTFGYNPERPVLHDVTFKAEPGQMVALVGATGGGKSSIISLIARFYQPQQGRVLVDGQDIRHVTGDSLHHQMGLVLQVNYLFSGTVMDNIRYARPQSTDDEVYNAARAIGSYDAIMTLKDGFKTDVGERGANMSLGQRQLICFTRAFLADPRIFMLDEATSAVDTATELLVQRSLEKLLEGRTTFIVAHRLSTIMRADMILVIDQGRIIERGTHRELVDADGKYAHLYEQFVQSHA